MRSGRRDLKGKNVDRDRDRDWDRDKDRHRDENRGGRGRGTQIDEDRFVDLSKGWSRNVWDPQGRYWHRSRQLATGEVEHEYDHDSPEPAFNDGYDIFHSTSQGPSVNTIHTTDSVAENERLENVQDHDANFFNLYSQELSELGIVGQDNSSMVQTEQNAYNQIFQSYSGLYYPPVPLLTSSLENISIQDPDNDNSETAISSRIHDQPMGLSQLLSSSSPQIAAGGLNSAFQIIAEPSRFFTVGRVFKVLWTEPAGTTSSEDKTFLQKLSNGQEVFTKVRRFVVAREMQGCCLCLSLVTHNRQGATKTGVNPANYAAVYDIRQTPYSRYGESLQKGPFPIIIENASESVDPISRLNLGRVYTIEHNLKVLKVGRIPATHISLLQRYFVETITGVHIHEGERTGPVVSPDDSLNIRPISTDPQAGDLNLISDINDNLCLPHLANQLSRNSEVAAASSSDMFMPKELLSDQSSPWPKSAGGHAKHSIQVTEKLDKRYRVVPSFKSKSFWKVGRVFMMLWTETAVPRTTSPAQGSHMSLTMLGGAAYTEIRRFVVLQVGYGCSYCAPISTYGGQATLKPNLPEVSQHAIIYTQKEVPDEKQYKTANGVLVRENLTKDPIRVIREQLDKEGELVPTSRLNYSKLYTVEHNVPVLNIGIVHQDSMKSLLASSFVHRNDPPQGPIKRAPGERYVKHDKRDRY